MVVASLTGDSAGTREQRTEEFGFHSLHTRGANKVVFFFHRERGVKSCFLGSCAGYDKGRDFRNHTTS